MLPDSRNSIVLRFRTRFLVTSSGLSGQKNTHHFNSLDSDFRKTHSLNNLFGFGISHIPAFCQPEWQFRCNKLNRMCAIQCCPNPAAAGPRRFEDHALFGRSHVPTIHASIERNVPALEIHEYSINGIKREQGKVRKISLVVVGLLVYPIDHLTSCQESPVICITCHGQYGIDLPDRIKNGKEPGFLLHPFVRR